jgi:hypothetical protein
LFESYILIAQRKLIIKGCMLKINKKRTSEINLEPLNPVYLIVEILILHCGDNRSFLSSRFLFELR